MAQEKKSLEQRIKEQLADDQDLVPEEVSLLSFIHNPIMSYEQDRFGSHQPMMPSLIYTQSR